MTEIPFTAAITAPKGFAPMTEEHLCDTFGLLVGREHLCLFYSHRLYACDVEAIDSFLDQKEWRNCSQSRCSVKQLKEQVEVVLQPLLSTFDPKLFCKSNHHILKTRKAFKDEEVEKEKLKKKLDVKEKLKVFGWIAKLCSECVFDGAFQSL